MNRIIGIPSDGPDLDDAISEHFGHCKYFVGVQIKDGKILEKAFSLKNNGHSSCMEPVLNMKAQNVKEMIVGGIGGRPYMGFLQEGIKLYQGIKGTIKDNVKILLEGKLMPLGNPSCGGNNPAHH